MVEPTDRLAVQKVALVRLYLHTPGTVWVTPTIEREFLRIRDEARRASHVSWTSVLFGVRPLNDVTAVERHAASLGPFHADLDDRLVLAESEDIGFASLVSFDTKVREPSGEARPAPAHGTCRALGDTRHPEGHEARQAPGVRELARSRDLVALVNVQRDSVMVLWGAKPDGARWLTAARVWPYG